jgi:hypothetical protein
VIMLQKISNSCKERLLEHEKILRESCDRTALNLSRTKKLERLNGEKWKEHKTEMQQVYKHRRDRVDLPTYKSTRLTQFKPGPHPHKPK